MRNLGRKTSSWGAIHAEYDRKQTDDIISLTLILLLFKFRISSDLKSPILGVNTPDKPLLCNSNLTELFASLHSIPYHSQCLVNGSIHKSLLVHSPPLADSKKSFRAFLSFGHKILSFIRSKPDMKQRVKGAGEYLWMS